MSLKLVVTIFVCSFLIVDGAKILAICHFPSNSHFILGSALLKALAKRGHEVTMLSPFLLKTPVKNYEDIEITGMLEFKDENIAKNILQLANRSMIENMFAMTTMMHNINERFFNNPSVKDLLASNRTFDLVIQSWFGNEAYLAIPHHFGAATIALSTIGGSTLTNYITRNPAPYSYVPTTMGSFPDEMTFLQRVGNTLINICFDILKAAYMSINEEGYRQKYFPNAPPTYEMVKNISLILLNSHYSLESPRPYVPNMIQIGGFHLEEPKPLKGDLKTFMDSAKEGVIFFSLGSNIKSSDLPEDKLDGIIKCFSKLPLKILWKFEDESVSNLPPNVKIGKWLPQKDILAHSNTKLFLSHGGLLSTTEAVYLGVPMVGIPIFGDQESNVEDSVRKGYALKVSFQDLSEETLTNAINEVLNNPRYRDNIKKRSLILKDQPIKPIDNAVYWVEYVLRHNGAHHLKTSAIKLEWYQYLLLDVIAFLLGSVLIAFCITYYIIRFMLRGIRTLIVKIRKPSKSLKVSKKKKKTKLA